MSDSSSSKRLEHTVLTAMQSRDPDIISGKIEHIDDLSPTVKGFTLKLDSKNKSFKAGQWVDFFYTSLDQVGGFSVCNATSKTTHSQLVDLAVKYSEWPPANWLHTQSKIGNFILIAYI